MKKVKLIPAIIVVVLILIASLPCQAEEEQHMANLFERHGSVMLIIDPNTGAIERANKAAAEFYGYPAEELEKMRIQDINMLTPEEVVQEMKLAAVEERNYFNFQHLLASGDIRHVEVYSYPVQWEGKTKLYSIIHDVTPRLEAEQALYKTTIFIFVFGIVTVILTAIALLLHHKVKTRNKTLSERKEAEEALSIANKNMTTVLENSLFGVAIIDKKRTIRWVNPVVCKLAGVESPDQIIGSQCSEYLCPAEQHECPILDKGQKLDNSERILRRSDGLTIPILKSVTEIMFEGEEVLLETFIDISDRNQAEEALREREHRFNLAINGTGAGLWDWDMVTDTVFFSERWKAMLGYTDDEVENAFSGWQKLWHPDDVEKIEKALQDHLDGKTEKYEIEHRARHKDGSWCNILTRGDLIKDDQGKPVRWVGTNLDLTHIKKMEEERSASETKYRDLIENMSEIIYTLDKTAKISYVSHSIEPILGYKPEELINKTFAESSIIHPDDLAGRFENFSKVMAGGKVTSDYRFIGKAGQVVWVKTSARPIFVDGQVTGLQGVLIDITERKQAEEALARRLAFEEMLVRVSSNFVSLPPELIDDGINFALKSVGEYFEVDRSYLYRFSEGGKTYSNTHLWCKEGIEGYYKKNQDFPVNLTPWWVGELKSGRLINIADVIQMPAEAALDQADFLSEQIKSIFTMPLTLEGKVFGCFGFDTVNEQRNWTAEQVDLLQIVAELITGAIARHDADRQIRVLSFHDQLTGIYNRRYFEHEMERLDRSREHPIAVISADIDGLKLVNDTLGHRIGDRFLQTGAEVLKSALRASDVLARVGGDEFALLLPRTGKAEAGMLVNRIRRQVEEYNLAEEGLPLSISLGLAVSESDDYTLEETYRMADNNMYTDKLQQGKKARAEIVSALLASLFGHGNLAEGDRDQVQALAIRLGQVLNLKEERLTRLALLGQVYDLGKVGLPDNLLHHRMLGKVGELSEAEREAIHRHPETGYRIATASPELLGVADYILMHHENYDGSGYPQGIKSDSIPVENRILSIAIAYSAMTNPRPYAKTLTHEEALAELKRCAGSQFDPELVKAFAGLME